MPCRIQTFPRKGVRCWRGLLRSGNMDSSVLTPLQQQVLVALFDNGLADRGYYLTGGTALSAVYLQHRYSDDLDFFTRKRDRLEEDFRYCGEILTSIGIVVASQDITEAYARLFVYPEDQEDTTLKRDYSIFAGFYYGLRGACIVEFG